jgi:hypothetical protein
MEDKKKPTPPPSRYHYEGSGYRVGVVGDEFWQKLERREKRKQEFKAWFKGLFR